MCLPSRLPCTTSSGVDCAAPRMLLSTIDALPQVRVMQVASELFLTLSTDFDEWVALGAEGWSYKDLHPFVLSHDVICAKLGSSLCRYFLKSERFHPSHKHPRVNPANHGSFGPNRTGFPRETAVGLLTSSARVLSDA